MSLLPSVNQAQSGRDYFCSNAAKYTLSETAVANGLVVFEMGAAPLTTGTYLCALRDSSGKYYYSANVGMLGTTSTSPTIASYVTPITNTFGVDASLYFNSTYDAANRVCWSPAFEGSNVAVGVTYTFYASSNVSPPSS